MGHILTVIEEKLEAKKMSKRKLAKILGIHWNTLNPGKEEKWSISLLRQISAELEIPMSDFFEESPAEIANRKNYKMAQALINMAMELNPEYKKGTKSEQPKVSKQAKKKPHK